MDATYCHLIYVAELAWGLTYLSFCAAHASRVWLLYYSAAERVREFDTLRAYKGDVTGGTGLSAIGWYARNRGHFKSAKLLKISVALAIVGIALVFAVGSAGTTNGQENAAGCSRITYAFIASISFAGMLH